MAEVSEKVVREIVQSAIDKLQPNPLGLRLAENGVHEVDGRWWAVIDSSVESVDRTQVWESIAQLEEMFDAAEHPDVRVLVTAA